MDIETQKAIAEDETYDEVPEQLADVIITFNRVAVTPDGIPYATTQVYRFEYEGTPEQFIETIMGTEKFFEPDSKRQIIDLERLHGHPGEW